MILINNKTVKFKPINTTIRINRYSILMWLYILLCSRLFFLLPIGNDGAIKVAGLFFCLMYIFTSHKNSKKLEFKRIIGFFIVYSILEILISWIKYGQNITDVLYCQLGILSFFGYYVLANNYNELKRNIIIKALIVNSIIMSTVFLCIYLWYTKTGSVLLFNVDMDSGLRFGYVRISFGCYFVALGIILAWGQILKGFNGYKALFKHNIWFFYCIIVGFIYLSFSVKIRMLLAAVIISIITMSLFCLKKPTKKMLIFVILFCVGAWITSTDLFQQYFELVTTAKTSSLYRTEAYTYYMTSTKDYIFGTGIIYEPSASSNLVSLLHSSFGNCDRTDVGIVGLYSTYGIIGVIWYILLIVKLTKKQFVQIKEKMIYRDCECIGLLLYLIVTSATLIVTDYSRIAYLPIILLLFENFRDKPEKGAIHVTNNNS